MKWKLFLGIFNTFSTSQILCNIKLKEDYDWWTGKDVEGSSYVLFYGTMPALLGGIEKTHKKLVRIAGYQAENQMWIESKSSNHLSAKFNTKSTGTKHLCMSVLWMYKQHWYSLHAFVT